MGAPRFVMLLSKIRELPLRRFLGILAVTLILNGGLAAQTKQAAAKTSAANGEISSAQFSRTIQDFSEEEGNFSSDNFISNETSYLHVVDKLKQLGVSGGAYIGVGPEQNFTYIAKIRPQIAFIVDIRRQAIIQHLMYKAIFYLSDDRTQFLSRLFSKPLKGKGVPGRDAPLGEIVAYFEDTPASQEFFSENLDRIRKTIEKDFEFPLSPSDQRMLGYVYSAFQQGNLGITTRSVGGAGGGWYGGSPTLKDLLLEKDLNGKMGGFLATTQDYDFLRELHRKNRIIPVVGDFAGPKALASVAGYLRENGYTVAAFYTSNVEQYLFGNQVFGAFAENVRKLPMSDKSVFIRSMRTGWQAHPANLPGHRMTTLLQMMTVFLKDYDQGLYTDYGELVTTHFIAGNEP
jgi:hypothetical protein